MRRGLERYAPEDGYDPGPIARSKLSQIVVQKAGLFPGDWVLDVETGTGILGVNVARAFTRTKTIVTDTERENLEKARENADTEGCRARMAFVQCLPEALPFKDETFFFATVGMTLNAHEEPLEVFDEIHRATGYYSKIYAIAIDLTRLKKKPRGIDPWVFDDETVDELRGIGFGKVQKQQIAVLPDGARLFLVSMKRFDPEDEEGDEDEEDEE